MNEQLWLTSTDPARMIGLLEAGRAPGVTGLYRASDRKLSLICEAIVPHLNPDRPLAWLVRWASHPSRTPAELRQASEVLRDVIGNPFRPAALSWHEGRPCSVSYAHHGLSPKPTAYHEPVSWLTPTVLSLAQAAYEGRLPDGLLDPVRLAVLADALEEAGCEQEPLLRHLRTDKECPGCGRRWDDNSEWRPSCPWCGQVVPRPAPHTRGCWAIDLLLGKG